MAYAGFDKASQTISFAYPLQCTGGNMTNPGISFIQNTGTGFYTPASNTVGITAGGTEIMRVTGDGKVGIGTRPTATLDVLASNNSTALSVVQTGSGAIFACASNNTSTGLFVANNGYTGINTQSPLYPLHIYSPLSSNATNFIGFPSVTVIEESAPLANNSPTKVIASGVLAQNRWFKRIVNSMPLNTIGVLLDSSTNLFTLPIGTYLVQAEAIANGCGKHKIGLSNAQTNSFVATGSTEYNTNTTYFISTKSTMTTIVVCPTSTQFGLYHWIASVNSSERYQATGQTFGYNDTSATTDNLVGNEVYARIIITKYQ